MITIEVKGIKEAMAALDPKMVALAASLAINEASRQTRTEASVAIREKFNLPAARVNKEVRNLSMSTRANLTAVIQAKGRPIGLTNFGAKWVRNVGGRAVTTTKTKSTIGKRLTRTGGVTAQIERGKTTRLPNAFIAAGRRGKVDGAGALQVFQRRDLTKGNSQIINRATVTLASMMANDRVMKRLINKASEVIDRRFAYHLDRLLK